MENTPFGSGSYEAPDSGAEKPDKETKKDKKKKAPIEAPVASDKKKSPEDVARSIHKLPLFEREPEEKPKKPEVSDTGAEAPLESLSTEETEHITRETAREHLSAIEQADQPTAEQLQPAADFLERVADGQDVEEAFHQAAQEAGLSEEEIAELEDAPEEAPEETVAHEEPAADPAAETIGDFDTAEDAEGTVSWRSASGTTSGAAASGSSGSTTPPPTPPTPPAGATPPPPRPPVPPIGPVAPGLATPNTAPNTLPAQANRYYVDRNKAGELLLIGFVGYLIGRRRGRIRAEKRLLPVQKKLEKQVKQLEQNITQKEQRLVAAVAEKRKAEARPVVTPVERTQPSRVETRLNVAKPVRAERLGHMVVAAEAPRRTNAPEKPKPAVDTKIKAEHVPDLSRNELLEVSDKIIVEGASLRRIYESRLIGEKQLRHLVREHLQGRDIRKDLRHEMVEHEIDFERDPILRDRVRSKLAASEGGGLGEMLAKAGITTDEVDPAFEKRVEQEEARQAADARKRQRTRAVADSVMVTAIVGLAALVAYLVLRG